MNKRIPFHDFGGDGPILHFAHANGYHPKAYHKILQGLRSQFRVIAYEARPFWPNSNPLELHNWEEIADDLIRFLEENQFKNVIGVGHSLGGISTAIAALKRPDLFQKLVLLDPVLLPNFAYYLLGLPRSLKLKFIPVAKIANRRRDTWDSKQAAYDYLRRKRVFNQIPDEVFSDIIEHCILEEGGKARLRYSKEWETQIYMTPSNIWAKLGQISQETLAIRGVSSDVLIDKAWNKWQAKQSNASFHSLPDAGHLVPFEQAQLVTNLIKEFCAY